MSTLTDLKIPLSALEFAADGTAHARADDWSPTQIGVLLQTTIEHAAQNALDGQSLHVVSVTFDVSADAVSGEEIQFRSRIDRKTRTLIFASGLASQGDDHLLKATVVFRLS